MRNKTIIFLALVFFAIGIILLLPKTTKKTYAAGTTLSETVKLLSSGSSWSTGASGVYYTNSHEYRYIGAEVNNYVWFNDDMYRIIGVFDDYSHGIEGQELVKIIRNRKIGSYAWGIYNSSATSGTYYGYKNDWTGNTTGIKANANVLLNEYFYNKTNTSSTYGACSDWTYYHSDTNYRTNDCSIVVGYGIDSSLKNYIEEVTWYLKGYTGNGYNKQNFYLCERGQSTDTTNCMSGNSGAYDASMTGKIGLMYASDYLYASGYYSNDDTTVVSSSYYGNKNWLYQGFEWTLTPDANSAYSVFYIYNSGYISTYESKYAHNIRPTFYLKSSVYVTGGDGSFDNPYTIACDDCD